MSERPETATRPEVRNLSLTERPLSVPEKPFSAPGTASEGLSARQDAERLALAQKYRALGVPSAASEAAEMLESLKSRIYAALGIHPDLESNGTLGKFRKGFVDVLVLENVDFVKTVLEVGLEKVLAALKETLLSIPNLKRMFEEVAEGLRKKAEGALRFEPYSMGGASATLASGMVGMVRSAAKTATRSELLAGVRNAVDGLSNPSLLRIELGKPPAHTGRIIYEHADAIDRAALRNGGAEVAKVIELVRSTGAYLKHHGHEVGKLDRIERNHFHGSVDLLIRQVSRVLADERIPFAEREAIKRAFVNDFVPHHTTKT